MSLYFKRKRKNLWNNFETSILSKTGFESQRDALAPSVRVRLHRHLADVNAVSLSALPVCACGQHQILDLAVISKIFGVSQASFQPSHHLSSCQRICSSRTSGTSFPAIATICQLVRDGEDEETRRVGSEKVRHSPQHNTDDPILRRSRAF